MSRYTATTPADLEAMLATIGVGSVAEIFDRQIPAAVRLERALDLPPGLPEQDVYEHLRALAARNVSAEDELSFLGAGVQPPNASWGTMIADGYQTIYSAPHLTIVPGLMIVFTVLSLNVFGDGLRDALDPKAKIRLEH